MMATEKNNTNDNAQIRQQIDAFVNAFRTRDLDLMVSLYAPGMVSFDIVPPLQVVGRERYREVWKAAFSFFRDPVEIEMRDLSITTGHVVAFSHKLLRLRATMTNGQPIDYWERMTLCFCKMDGNWLITHEHVSVPANLEEGSAVLDLRPAKD
jgi:ketosteroid isomerase-like protein